VLVRGLRSTSMPTSLKAGAKRIRVSLSPFGDLGQPSPSCLKQADVPRGQAAEILGHDREIDVTYDRYGKPAAAKRQLEVIKKLTFSLNLG
jgi:hypothetical protein